MEIELDAPASLLLGLVPLGASVAALSLALKYPPIQLVARPAPTLDVSGACAPYAYAAATRYARVDPDTIRAEVEIELAVPALMGLGSEPMMALSTARALAALAGGDPEAPALARALDFPPHLSPEVWGFAQGGLLLVDVRAPLETPPLRHRHWTHPDDATWVVVLVLPKPGEDAPDTLEAGRRAALMAAVPYWDSAVGALVMDQLWPAVERDDFAAFAGSLQRLHDANLAALAAAGTPVSLTPTAQTALDVMRAEGVPACGPCLTGLGVYGLIRGRVPSIELRKRLAGRLGYEAGTIMGTLAADQGAKVRSV
jgi:predicted sugar kinase